MQPALPVSETRDETPGCGLSFSGAQNPSLVVVGANTTGPQSTECQDSQEPNPVERRAGDWLRRSLLSRAPADSFAQQSRPAQKQPRDRNRT